jgi:biopolymer transport protein ExbD
MARRRRFRKKRKEDKVELNLAAMLDMAFQLLTFFILTFRPAPVEGQLAVNMPPPVPMTRVDTQQAAENEGEGVSARETLHLFVTANERGSADEVRIGGFVVAKGSLDAFQLQQVAQGLKQRLNVAATPFDQVQIAVDGRLRYEELMKLIDVCTKQEMPDGKLLQRISFTELPRGGAAE